MRKALILMFAVLASVLLAAPASADGASVQESRTARDRCVETTVWYDRQTITGIQVLNACGHTLGMVDGHVYNTSAGLDQRSGPPIDLPAYRAFTWGWMGGWPTRAAYGSWTCGEIWGPGGYLYGRACVQMGDPT